MFTLAFRWLVKKKRREKALVVLARIRCSTPEEVKEEFNEIVLSTKSDGDDGGLKETVKLLLEWKVFQRYGSALLRLNGKFIFSFLS